MSSRKKDVRKTKEDQSKIWGLGIREYQLLTIAIAVRHIEDERRAKRTDKGLHKVET